jgi:hypothetical protein
VVAGRVVTGLAAVLVWLVLVTPGDLDRLTPAAFLRVPLDGLVAVAVILALRGRARRIAAITAGVAIGVLAVLKVLDLGFTGVLDRPFDPVFDWGFLEAALVFVDHAYGRAGAVGAAVAAGLLAVGLVVAATLAVVRLSRLAVAHRAAVARTVGVLGVVWAVVAVAGVYLVPTVPVAAREVYERVDRARDSLADQEAFAAEVAVDAYRDTPGPELLTALRGKDVVFVFVESYGRVALEHPEVGPGVGAVLADGTSRLRSAGYAARSAYLTSPTVGGGSWLAQSTLLSGLWVHNPQRYHTLLHSDRSTLPGLFRRAGWRSVGIMPGIIQGWPEGSFFNYDRIYAAKDLGYRGPTYSFATMPDQYVLSTFEQLERPGPPVMAVIPLLSSHAPWSPRPRLLDWDAVGDGSVYEAAEGTNDAPEIVWQRDVASVRADYRASIEYSLATLVSYVQTYGGDDLVLVFLGDHQPAPVVTGPDASKDSPVTIVARDPAVLDRVAGWGWSDGLAPNPRSPVWRMDTFRDRFLAAFD